MSLGTREVSTAYWIILFSSLVVTLGVLPFGGNMTFYRAD